MKNCHLGNVDGAYNSLLSLLYIELWGSLGCQTFPKAQNLEVITMTELLGDGTLIITTDDFLKVKRVLVENNNKKGEIPWCKMFYIDSCRDDCSKTKQKQNDVFYYVTDDGSCTIYNSTEWYVKCNTNTEDNNAEQKIISRFHNKDVAERVADELNARYILERGDVL